MMRAQELRTRHNQTRAFEDVEERIQDIRDALTSTLGDAATNLSNAILRTDKHTLDPDPGAVINGWLEFAIALGNCYRHIGQL